MMVKHNCNAASQTKDTIVWRNNYKFYLAYVQEGPVWNPTDEIAIVNSAKPLPNRKMQKR